MWVGGGVVPQEGVLHHWGEDPGVWGHNWCPVIVGGVGCW